MSCCECEQCMGGWGEWQHEPGDSEAANSFILSAPPHTLCRRSDPTMPQAAEQVANSLRLQSSR